MGWPQFWWFQGRRALADEVAAHRRLAEEFRSAPVSPLPDPVRVRNLAAARAGRANDPFALSPMDMLDEARRELAEGPPVKQAIVLFIRETDDEWRYDWTYRLAGMKTSDVVALLAIAGAFFTSQITGEAE